jgi:metallo-beta-lactamase class B
LSGETWYVGTKGLGAILITSKQGHILIDGGLPQSAPLIAANIEKAGFHLKDVKLILNSHTHYDHAGGIAALQRASGAQVAASPKAKIALEQGGPTEEDPQFTFGHAHNDTAPVKNVRGIKDGETLRVGPLAVTAHFTPGHTPGGTTWTWTGCDRDVCWPIVYADSLNSVSAPDFHFSDDPARVKEFQKSIDTVAGLECDMLLAPHPELFNRDAKLAARTAQNPFGAFRVRGECRTYAEAARQRLEKRIAEERRRGADFSPAIHPTRR